MHNGRDKMKAPKAKNTNIGSPSNNKRKAPPTHNHPSASERGYPVRDLDKLYCPAITYLCATGARGDPPCVPCAYKIGTFDIALDSEFTKRVPNQRPEQCPRSNARGSGGRHGQMDGAPIDGANGMMGYRRGMNVLTVGDGDFTFSLAVAQHVVGDGGKSRGMVVATSYEDAETLRGVYPDFGKTLNSLNSQGEARAIVGYKVDAIRLDETLPKQLQRDTKGSVRFHRICWNFPCTAIGSGQDGQNDAMEQNKELVRTFVANALPYLDEECGEIHMAHKTKPPYNQWELEKVALEGIEHSRSNDESKRFEYKGRVAFDKCTLPPYTPRKALDRKSFPCHDACIYVFGWKAKESVNSSDRCTIPERIPDLSNEETPDPSSIIPLAESVIEKVRSIHLLHAEARAGAHGKKSSGRKNKRRKK